MRPRSAAALALVAVVALVAAATSGGTFGAFSQTTANDGNSFAAAPSFSSPLRHATGTYTGTGADNRAVPIGFAPDVVIVKATSAQTGVVRSSTMTGDASKPMVGLTGLTANLIQALTATGFTVGTDARVNQAGVTYTWTAFKTASGSLAIGSYVGDGAAARTVTGTGFSPEWVAVLPATAQNATQRFKGMFSAYRFDADTGSTTRVTGLGADGFEVAAGPEVNTSGQTYHYLAFNEVAGSIDWSTYTGNATNDRAVTGVGFAPEVVMVRADDQVNARAGRLRAGGLTGTASGFFGAAADGATGLRALLADGFSVGTDTSVNAAGVAYHALAVRNAAGGCPTYQATTAVATVDTWIDERTPAGTNGTATTLRVSPRRDQVDRALVRTALPPVPSGCAVLSARLRLYNRTPVAGRTLQVLANAAAFSNATTWATQPPTTGTPATATATGTAGWMEWDVTAQVEAMSSGTNHGFSIRDAAEDSGTGDQVFDSIEATAGRDPALVVTVGTP